MQTQSCSRPPDVCHGTGASPPGLCAPPAEGPLRRTAGPTTSRGRRPECGRSRVARVSRWVCHVEPWVRWCRRASGSSADLIMFVTLVVEHRRIERW